MMMDLMSGITNFFHSKFETIRIRSDQMIGNHPPREDRIYRRVARKSFDPLEHNDQFVPRREGHQRI